MKTAVSTHEINIYPENDFEGYHAEVAKDIGAVVSEAEAKEQEWFNQYEARTKVTQAYAQILEEVQKQLQVVPTATHSMKIPLWKRPYLTIKEAAVYFGIGENRISSFVKIFEEEKKVQYIMKVGTKKSLVKRIEFEKFLNGQFSI